MKRTAGKRDDWLLYIMGLRRLSLREKSLLVIMVRLYVLGRACWIRWGTWGKLLSCSHSSVWRAVVKLEAEGWVHVHRRNGSNCSYRPAPKLLNVLGLK